MLCVECCLVSLEGAQYTVILHHSYYDMLKQQCSVFTHFPPTKLFYYSLCFTKSFHAQLPTILQLSPTNSFSVLLYHTVPTILQLSPTNSCVNTPTSHLQYSNAVSFSICYLLNLPPKAFCYCFCYLTY